MGSMIPGLWAFILLVLCFIAIALAPFIMERMGSTLH
jgi:hypothetical protein